jgi:glycosyltransferase involved in cell wall biosynthesis
MKILFVHQNFPGQFLHLAPALAARGHKVLALTDEHNARPSPVEVLRYRAPTHTPDPAALRLARTYAKAVERGIACARAARSLRDKHGFMPDLIIGHSGWGETLFLRSVWPKARIVIYAEYYYRARGLDSDFDAEFLPENPDRDFAITAEQAHLGHALAQADAAICPTEWQAATFPPVYRPMIHVMHDGIDTARLAPDQGAQVTLPNAPPLHAGDEVLTFVNRNLEPYRGYHIFMRALPLVLAARPKAQVVIVGGDGVSYGRPASDGRSWKETFLTEVADRIDPARVHFTGRVPYAIFAALMQVTRVHAYLTYPFVLSWSVLEAMAAGAHIVASDTGPVREVITQGETGDLVGFFDVPGWAARLTGALAHPARHDPQRRAARALVQARYDLHSICLPRQIAFIEGFSPPTSPGNSARP